MSSTKKRKSIFYYIIVLLGILVLLVTLRNFTKQVCINRHTVTLINDVDRVALDLSIMMQFFSITIDHLSFFESSPRYSSQRYKTPPPPHISRSDVDLIIQSSDDDDDDDNNNAASSSLESIGFKLWSQYYGLYNMSEIIYYISRLCPPYGSKFTRDVIKTLKLTQQQSQSSQHTVVASEWDAVRSQIQSTTTLLQSNFTRTLRQLYVVQRDERRKWKSCKMGNCHLGKKRPRDDNDDESDDFSTILSSRPETKSNTFQPLQKECFYVIMNIDGSVYANGIHKCTSNDKKKQYTHQENKLEASQDDYDDKMKRNDKKEEFGRIAQNFIDAVTKPIIKAAIEGNHFVRVYNNALDTSDVAKLKKTNNPKSSDPYYIESRTQYKSCELEFGYLQFVSNCTHMLIFGFFS